MADPEKHLERAQKYVSKNKFDAAIREYQAAYEQLPQNFEMLRTIADLCARAGRNDEATRFYGELFDKYAEKGQASKAEILFRKSLQDSKQPPARYHRLGHLLQRSGKTEEAVEAFRTARELFDAAGDDANALDCLDRLAALEPDRVETHIELAEHSNRSGKPVQAAKAYLRAGQLLRFDDLDRSLELLQHAYELAPERSTALTLAQVHLDKDDHEKAVGLLMPLYAESEEDPAVLETLATGLLAGGRLQEAAEVLEVFYKAKPDTYEKLFELASLHCQKGEVDAGVKLLQDLKGRLFADKRQKDYVARLIEVYRTNETVLPLLEFTAKVFNELNQESNYSKVLNKLFDLYFNSGDFAHATDTLERLIDIDPYDFSHQKRLESLNGKIDDARLRGVASRVTGATTVVGQAPSLAPSGQAAEEGPPTDPARRRALLEDWMVQVEIFLQYGLRPKAVEQLEKLYKFFPGEEVGNDRLHRLYEQAQYFPEGFGTPPEGAGAPAEPAALVAAPAPAAPAAAPSGADSFSDLAKISEITHAIFRQGTPKTVLHAAVSELGKYLRTSRCLGALGKTGRPPSTAVEFCSPGVPQSPGPAILKLLGILGEMTLDPDTGTVADLNLSPDLKQAGAQSVLAMPLVSKESQEQEGLIVLSQADHVRQWKPNEVYLVKAVADQAITAISHTKLRTLMKRLSVDEAASGLMSRSSYLNCLVAEVSRAKTQGTAVVVALLELDKGGQWLRQIGDAAMKKFMQQAGETLLASVRQSDLGFRYTSTSLAVMLGDTTVEKAKPVTDKLRAQLSKLKIPGGKDSITFSVGACEAAIRPDYDPVDIVTDVVNRAEFTLEEARKKGNAVVME